MDLLEGVGQILELNPLLLHMQEMWDSAGYLTMEGPGQMAQKVGVQSGGPRRVHRAEEAP